MPTGAHRNLSDLALLARVGIGSFAMGGLLVVIGVARF
jgi:hypothetical protein